jgi:hypothetical protein
LASEEGKGEVMDHENAWMWTVVFLVIVVLAAGWAIIDPDHDHLDPEDGE